MRAEPVEARAASFACVITWSVLALLRLREKDSSLRDVELRAGDLEGVDHLRAGHLALDLTAAILAFWMALDPPGRWLGAPGEPLSTLVPFLLFSTATVYLLYAVVDVLPRRRPAAPVPLISLSPTRGAQ